MSKPIILLLLNNRAVRLQLKNELEPDALVYAAVKLDEVVAEIKWNEIGAILLDMTDDTIDSYGMLGIINSTYPSVPVVLLVNSENGDLAQFTRNPQNVLLDGQPKVSLLAEKLLELTGAAKIESVKPEDEIDEDDGEDENIRVGFANQLTRLRANVRRIEDYSFGEAEKEIRGGTVGVETIKLLERYNIGLEGILQIFMEEDEER